MVLAVTNEGPVALLRWDDAENRLNLTSVARWNEALDELEARTGPLGVVATGTGKFFSNGLDLEHFSDTDELLATVDAVSALIGRLMVFPAYCVAAINGHAFAAGALLSCGFDYRIMREDRGYWCMNEAEIGLAVPEGLWSILEHRLPRASAVAAITTARRYAGPDALRYGIVEEVAAESEVLDRALSHAAVYAGLDRSVLGRHKRLVHGAEAQCLGFRI